MSSALGDARAVAVGFGAALAILLALLAVLGTEKVVSALAAADLRIVAALAVVSLLWLLSWGLALRAVLSALDIPASAPHAFVLFSAATFANNVTPFGQAGGEPFSALLVSRSTDAEYETALAAVASVDTLNFVPSISFALVGVGYYATVFTLGDRIELVAASLVALTVAVVAGVALGWRARRRVENAVVAVAVPAGTALAAVAPRIDPPEPDAVRERVRGFFRAIERIARDRRTLTSAFVFSAAGWFLLSLSLWLSLAALGHVVPLAAALFIVPLGSVAGVTPLPGGLGGVETALVLLLVPFTGVDAATAAAAAILHRAATYWLPILVGGGATAALEATRTRPEAS